jgi:SPP1 family predicted phage head-tail adaptor
MKPDRLTSRDLRHRITFQQETPTKSASGASIAGTWTDYKDAWAFIEQRAGSEQATQNRIEARATYQIATRYDSGITRTMRIKFTRGGVTKYFQIANLENWRFRDQWLIVDAVEGRVQGK